MRHWIFAACILILLGGCYGPINIAYHEPRHYKGAPDPLLDKESSPEQQKVLQARFEMGQFDR